MQFSVIFFVMIAGCLAGGPKPTTCSEDSDCAITEVCHYGRCLNRRCKEDEDCLEGTICKRPTMSFFKLCVNKTS